jgi:hypothetical protein
MVTYLAKLLLNAASNITPTHRTVQQQTKWKVLNLFMDNYFVLNQQQLSDLHDRELIKQLRHCSSADRT